MEPGIEFSQLRTFIVLGEELHFGRAAERLRVAQPALSQQIRRLETNIGFRLFDRTSRRVTLTASGVAFLEYARGMLNDLDRALISGREIANGNVGTVRVGYIATAMLTLLPRLIRDFRARQPKVRIELWEMSSAPQIDALLKGQLDVAIQTGSRKEHDIVCFEASREPLVAVLPTGGTRRLGSTISPKILAGKPLIMFPRFQAPALYDEVISICRKSGFEPPLGQEAQSWHMIAQLVASGIGVAIGPQSIEHYRVPGVRCITLRPGGSVSTTVCCLRQQANSAVELFVKMAADYSRSERS
jgi:DNA-binding transcriptional LysR family regulator